MLALGFGESADARAAFGVLVKLQRTAQGNRLEGALTGKSLASYPGAADGPPPGTLGLFKAVAVRHLPAEG